MATTSMFETVLVANRGEIAGRIIATLSRLGIRSVAVYSDADEGARHVALADVAVRIGPAPAAESYLAGAKIIRAALATGVQAIHPGYGFLSENAGFARACAEAGLVFIGPAVEALTVMGDKIRAKARVAERDVPTVPGRADPGLSDEDLADAIDAIGFPALIKPSAGGGGKGMHVVTAKDEVSAAIATARREAAASFGDDTLFIERFIAAPRHIEVQVLADSQGHTIHLGERECSLQRRHQKVIEEAPSVLLDAATRERIGRAAVETARSVEYLGAGTVEFIVSADAPDEFFFMEMNTRLQVEHPVTEMVTGIDLVEWQLRIAAGEMLTLSQDDVALNGHAIEARVYAEDPARGFLPTGGRVLALTEPAGEGVRVDSSLVPGLVVSSDYDPMLAKVVAWAPERGEALRRLRRALTDFATPGVGTNVEFLGLLLRDPDVVAGTLDTSLIARRLESLAFRPVDDLVLAAAALVLAETAPRDPWPDRTGWRFGAPAPRRFAFAAEPDGEAVVELSGPRGALTIGINGGEPASATIIVNGDRARVVLGQESTTFYWARTEQEVFLSQDGASWVLSERRATWKRDDLGDEVPELRSPMPGTVVAVHARDGERVEAGAPVLSVEAMKMEHVLRAPVGGIVELATTAGTQVAPDEVLATIRPDEAEDADHEEVSE